MGVMRRTSIQVLHRKADKAHARRGRRVSATANFRALIKRNTAKSLQKYLITKQPFL